MNQSLPLSFALQGGGAHGALTWGVLDRLLETERFSPAALSGTSAGAVNAVAFAVGWVDGGAEGARDALRRVWTAVSNSGPGSWLTTGSAAAPTLTSPARAAVRLTRSLSPYQLNPFGIDPLREVLARELDFDKLRDSRSPALCLAATNACTGRARVFTNDEISIDSVVASACLPSIHHAVIIDGEPYWDGGYSANPALLPLLDFAADVLVVLIAGSSYDAEPKTREQISAREAEFAFTASFQREAECLAAATALAAVTEAESRGPLERRLTRMRWHVLNAGPMLSKLSAESRIITHGPFLESLFDRGRELARDWFTETEPVLGRRSSAELATLNQMP